MRIPLRAFPVLLALVAVCVFPWPATLILIVIASGFVPLSGIVLGVLADSLYGAPGAFPFPLASLVGLIACGAGFFVHRFVKARIMGA